MIDASDRAAIFAAPLDTMTRISVACRTIEAEMRERLPGSFRAIYQPRGDSFVVRWDLEDGRCAEFDIERQRLQTASAPFGFLSVHLRHRVSLQEVR